VPVIYGDRGDSVTDLAVRAVAPAGDMLKGLSCRARTEAMADGVHTIWS
jgi:hypothetical protein